MEPGDGEDGIGEEVSDMLLEELERTILRATQIKNCALENNIRIRMKDPVK